MIHYINNELINLWIKKKEDDGFKPNNKSLKISD